MYRLFYKLLPVRNRTADENIHLLTDTEVAFIRKTEQRAISISAAIGAVMILILYVPKYIWTDFFADKPLQIPIIDKSIPFNIPGFIFGQALVFAEVFLLTLLSIYATHEIGVITGYIDRSTKSEQRKRDFLLNISRERKNKEVKNLGINPFLGLSKTRIFFMNLFIALKATLSNFLVRLFLQKILGRYAFRIVLDMAGIPVFAFWNAMGTRKILKESRVIIMGVNYLEQYENELAGFRTLSEKEKTLLYDTLQYIAISKRDYHQNHYVLTKILMQRFDIPVEKEHLISDGYRQELLNASDDFKALNEKVIVLGFLLDGTLSGREKKLITRLHAEGIIRTDKAGMLALNNAFVYGKGIGIRP